MTAENYKVFIKQKQQKLFSSKIGKKLWAKITKNFDFAKCEQAKCRKAYIVFPDDDAEINMYGLLYLDEFLLRWDYDACVIIASDRKVFEACEKYTKKIAEKFLFTKEEITSLIDFYLLFKFSNDVRFVSLDLPTGRNASALIGVNDLSKEKLVAIGIYHIIPFAKINVDAEIDTNFWGDNV